MNPQPPRGCSGQRSSLAWRQSSRVTYCSPARPVSNRSCTGIRPAESAIPAGLPSCVNERLASLSLAEPAKAARCNRPKQQPGCGHVDDALARTGAARGQREYTLPTVRAFAHMPTAFDHYEIKKTRTPIPRTRPSLPHRISQLAGYRMRYRPAGEMRFSERDNTLRPKPRRLRPRV